MIRFHSEIHNKNYQLYKNMKLIKNKIGTATITDYQVKNSELSNKLGQINFNLLQSDWINNRGYSHLFHGVLEHFAAKEVSDEKLLDFINLVIEANKVSNE